MFVLPPGVCSHWMEVMTDEDFMPFVAASVAFEFCFCHPRLIETQIGFLFLCPLNILIEIFNLEPLKRGTKTVC